MNTAQRKTATFRTAIVAGIAILSITGLSGLTDSANAFPTSPALGVLQLKEAAVTTVQYQPRGAKRRYHRRHYATRAGLYRCGPRGLHTHLGRQACGGN